MASSSFGFQSALAAAFAVLSHAAYSDSRCARSMIQCLTLFWQPLPGGPTPSRAGQSGAGDAGEERDARADDFADVQTYPLWPSDDTATRTLSTPLPLLLLLTTTMTMIHSYLSRCGQLSCISSNAHTHIRRCTHSGAMLDSGSWCNGVSS